VKSLWMPSVVIVGVGDGQGGGVPSKSYLIPVISVPEHIRAEAQGEGGGESDED
jgi:hypothetical protein